MKMWILSYVLGNFSENKFIIKIKNKIKKLVEFLNFIDIEKRFYNNLRNYK